METCVSDPPLTDAERTQRQGERLKGLRERLGVSKGHLMDTVGLKTTNGYDLYEKGTSVIRFNQVTEWALAFGISEREFIDEVLAPDESAVAGWTLAESVEYMVSQGIPDSEISGRIDVLQDLHPLSRKGAAEAFALIWSRSRSETARPNNGPHDHDSQSPHQRTG